MSDEPLVSIVIPCYQSERTVGAAISSALTQTYPNTEVIVVNDGGTDLGRQIAGGHGDLVRVLDRPNGGVAAARNTAIEAAGGEFIAILDADDILLPDYVSRSMDAWTKAGGGRRFVTTQAYIMGPRGIYPQRRILPAGAVPTSRQRMALIERNVVSIFSMFPVQMWREIGGFDEAMRYCEDYDFWARAVFSGWEIVFQTEPQALYRRAEGTASRVNDRMWEGTDLTRRHIVDTFGDSLTPGEREHLDLVLEHGPSEKHVYYGEQALAGGDLGTARDEFGMASRLVPNDHKLRLKANLLRVPGLSGVLAGRQTRRQHQVDG